MNISEEELRKKVKEWAKGNERAGWFSEEELVEIAEEASERIKRQGGNFIHAFDHIVYIKSITEGKIPKKSSN